VFSGVGDAAAVARNFSGNWHATRFQNDAAAVLALCTEVGRNGIDR
jgi:hypothetical protein